ncbi:hypothetical protein ACVWYF_000663 [Hymenobacter sp. UYAg731]
MKTDFKLVKASVLREAELIKALFCVFLIALITVLFYFNLNNYELTASKITSAFKSKDLLLEEKIKSISEPI